MYSNMNNVASPPKKKILDPPLVVIIVYVFRFQVYVIYEHYKLFIFI